MFANNIKSKQFVLQESLFMLIVFFLIMLAEALGGGGGGGIEITYKISR